MSCDITQRLLLIDFNVSNFVGYAPVSHSTVTISSAIAIFLTMMTRITGRNDLPLAALARARSFRWNPKVMAVPSQDAILYSTLSLFVTIDGDYVTWCTHTRLYTKSVPRVTYRIPIGIRNLSETNSRGHGV